MELILQYFQQIVYCIYLNSLPSLVREKLQKDWREAMKDSELEVSDPFNLVSALTPPLHIRTWGLEGLPTDSFSLQNATIIKHTVKLVQYRVKLNFDFIVCHVNEF